MFFKRFFAALRERRQQALFPESTYHVTWDASAITCTSPSGEIQSVAWRDLQSVVLRTTDAGPFIADVFWFLQGSASICMVPQGARGEPELLHRLQELPDFNSEAVIAGMSSTDNAEFLCWSRKKP